MSVFKCKMCGGNVEFEEGASVGICDSCGTKQTLPKLSDDKRARLYDRANHFRRNNDFDKAAELYENILNEDDTDSEAYWSLVLCRFGIEYVENPSTHKRVPTVNRAQFTSIFDDENYKSAIEYADASQKEIYEEEAHTINEIQKGILSISQKEEPFDIFICYKESDASGRRTPDSVLAYDLYHNLVKEGFKVFFARVTLEDKLGTEYEPYIFAALSSAKVMVVIGTKPEYFNATWVKNEWSRYLKIVEQSKGEKILIPAYRDMDPYDLPDELSHLQAQDMSKLGFMQDLTRGIKKIVNIEERQKETQVVEKTVVENPINEIDPLLKRAYMFIEEKNWKEADTYAERVLDQDPENASAYLVKFMVAFHIYDKGKIPELPGTYLQNSNFEKAMRFAQKNKDTEILEIKEQLEKQKIENQYYEALQMVKKANSEKKYKLAAEAFKEILEYKDSDALYNYCLDAAEEARKYDIYNKAKLAMQANNVRSTEEAISGFNSILGWKDTEEQLEQCKINLEEQKIKEEEERLERERKQEQRKIAIDKAKNKIKANLKIIIGSSSAVIFLILLFTTIIPNAKYSKANRLIEERKYIEAHDLLASLHGFKNSDEIIDNINTKYKDQLDELERNTESYETAMEKLKEEDYVGAYEILTRLGDFKDSENQLAKFNDKYLLDKDYNDALTNFAGEEYYKAYELFVKLKDFKESASKAKELEKTMVEIYNESLDLIEKKDYFEAKQKLDSIEGYKDSKNKLEAIADDYKKDTDYNFALNLIEEEKFVEAYEKLEGLGDFKDSSEKFKEITDKLDAIYNDAVEAIKNQNYIEASDLLSKIEGFKDSSDKKEEIAENCDKEVEYNDATTLMNEENYIEASEKFISLEDFKDSKKKIQEICKKNQVAKNYLLFKDKNVGDYVKFGSYEQDNNEKNGSEAIEWQILEKDDSSALLISRFGLYNAKFHSYWQSNWSNCELKGWLNIGFYVSAFNIDEQETILSTNLLNGSCKVFLLTTDLLEKYFGSNKERICQPTKFAIENDDAKVYDNFDGTKGSQWWLSSQGNAGLGYTAVVMPDGDLYYNGLYNTNKAVVRPCIRVKISN